MIDKSQARELIATACEKHRLSEEAQFVREGRNCAFHIDVAIDAVIAAHLLGVEEF